MTIIYQKKYSKDIIFKWIIEKNGFLLLNVEKIYKNRNKITFSESSRGLT